MAPDPEAPLTVVVDVDGDQATLALAGELDPHTAPLLQERIEEAVAAGATHLHLDLAGIGFIDSSGLRVVIAARRAAQERGGSLGLRSPSPTVRRLLEITGLLDHLEVADDAGPAGAGA